MRFRWTTRGSLMEERGVERKRRRDKRMHLADIITVAMPSIVAVLYAITAIAYACKKEWAWALTWGAYALANVGLIVAGNR